MLKSGFYFRDWIDLYGRRKLAKRMGVTKNCVDKWVKNFAIPEAPHMRKIKKISGGVVDYNHIIDKEPIRKKRPKSRL